MRFSVDPELYIVFMFLNTLINKYYSLMKKCDVELFHKCASSLYGIAEVLKTRFHSLRKMVSNICQGDACSAAASHAPFKQGIKMNYVYITIYRFEGISGNNLDKDKIVYQDNTSGISVILTNDVNKHCSKLDIGVAAAKIMLQRVFGSEISKDPFKAIGSEVAKIQEERSSKKNTEAYAVIRIEGVAQLNIDEQRHQETDQLHICFDAIDKNLLKKTHKEKIHAIVSSLSMSTSPEYNARKVISGIYFIDENGKPLYTFTMGGHARATVSRPIDNGKQQEITKIIGLSTRNKQFNTPFRLFTQSLEATEDELRSFTSAWSALEILVNKVFSSYEEKFIANISNDHNSHGVKEFLGRIKNVMKDKYRLTDKFSLIASFLSDEAEEDIELFKSMKRLRDDISHGKEFNEKALPVEKARQLLAKYLKDHLLSTESA